MNVTATVQACEAMGYATDPYLITYLMILVLFVGVGVGFMVGLYGGGEV